MIISGPWIRREVHLRLGALPRGSSQVVAAAEMIISGPTDCRDIHLRLTDRPRYSSPPRPPPR